VLKTAQSSLPNSRYKTLFFKNPKQFNGKSSGSWPLKPKTHHHDGHIKITKSICSSVQMQSHQSHIGIIIVSRFSKMNKNQMKFLTEQNFGFINREFENNIDRCSVIPIHKP
jgi:hypothetical protein